MRHRVQANEQLHRTWVHGPCPTWEFEILLIPGRCDLWISLHPCLGIGNQVSRRCNFVHQPLRLRRCGIQRLTLNDHHRRVLQADEAGRPLRSAATGQQSDHDFGHAKLYLRMICDNAIMACQGKLKATAQRKAVERASDRLCRNLTRTKVLGRLTARFHFAQ